MQIFNTLSKQIEPFLSLQKDLVRLYTCGPTVYNFAHIGNLRTYIFEDILRRTLETVGYQVMHVMNVTDVGHLQSDADEGDDKMSVAAQREQKSPWEIARFYEGAFFKDCDALGILRPTVVCRATEHIPQMQEMVKKLVEKGAAYVVDGNVYFRIKSFPTYAKLSGRNLDELLEGARVDVDARKEDPRDFVLWFSQSKYPHQIMKWESPWGVGFPGWHIECSAMASEYLGEHIDIHTGGIDHISVHHSNEIAQSEACFGHKWVNYWMHGEFLVVDKGKMAKSAGNFLTLASLQAHGFEALHYRYLCLGSHYRSQLLFSFEALAGAKNAFEALKNRVISWKLNPQKGKFANKVSDYKKRFWERMADDLDTPVALSVVWEVAKDGELASSEKLDLLTNFDSVLGLGIAHFTRPALSPALQQLVEARESARKNKDYAESDRIRQELLQAGLQVKDTPSGPDWYFL